MDTIFKPIPGQRRRRHSTEFKHRIVTACLQPDVSIASIALHNGLNANLLRRWVTQYRENLDQTVTALTLEPTATADSDTPTTGEEFVSLAMPTERRQSGDRIHIDLEHQGTRVSVSWPIEQAPACALWLRQVLR